MNKLCECGCGGEIIYQHHHKYRNIRFISGHNSKIKNPMLGKKWTEDRKNSIKGEKNPNFNNHKLAGIKKSKEWCDNISKGLLGINSHRKGISMEQEYGIERANEIKKTISITTKESMTEEETKQKVKKNRLLRVFPLKDTSIEVKMQNELQNRNINFKKHKVISNIENKYQCDIFIEPNIVIECDGNYWHDYPNHTEKDKIRTEEMEQQGYAVFRFWESEINKNVELCVSEVQEYLERSMKYYEFNKEVHIYG